MSAVGRQLGGMGETTMVRHELTAWQAVTGARVLYS